MASAINGNTIAAGLLMELVPIKNIIMHRIRVDKHTRDLLVGALESIRKPMRSLEVIARLPIGGRPIMRTLGFVTATCGKTLGRVNGTAEVYLIGYVRKSTTSEDETPTCC